MDYLVSGLEMAELDRQTIENCAVPGRVLMEVAGRAVAEQCHKRLAARSNVAVICGTGNNGGDGFVTARALAALGHEVEVFVVGETAQLKADAASTLAALKAVGGVPVHTVSDARTLRELSQNLGRSALAVDALFGTGLHREVRGLLGDVIDVLNEAPCPVVAVDVPSGVDADTGMILGRAVKAKATVTFAFPKRGHFLFPGAGLRGELVVADIGIPRVLAERLGVVGRVLREDDGPALLPVRDGGAHKGQFGHVTAWAGSPETPGAAILALRGALRAGAGLVSWATDEATLHHAPPRPAEVMLRLRKDSDPQAWAQAMLERSTALVIGPGLSTSDDRLADLRAVLAVCAVPICMDADGLNLLAREPELWQSVHAPLVITPHPKEMARLLGTDVDAVQRDRFGVAVQVAMSRRCLVVLKGAGTVVAEPDGTAAVIGAGNPGMATGGTGDVLAGVIGGLLAQALDVSAAARVGALLHAVAGDRAAAALGQTGMVAGDLADSLGVVLREWDR